MAKQIVTRGCKIGGCEKPHRARGWCSTHWSRWHHSGSPFVGGTFNGEPIQWIKYHINYKGDDCLKWPFAASAYGYGNVAFYGKYRVASRVMCILAHGEPMDEKLHAAHSCGNGHLACMNPNHISWKTCKENRQDSIKHGTWAHGEKVGPSKLNREQVLEIRALEGKLTQQKIGDMFGVNGSQIGRIFSRKSWAWLE